MSELEESAKAVTEVAKLSTTVLDKASNAIGLFVKYIDEPLSVLCGILVDNKKFDRWENQVKIQDKVNSILKERGVNTIRMIPPKLGIPLIDNALLEDDDDLREFWCRLIANSIDPNFKEEIRYAYVEIIKNLTPFDAGLLKFIYEHSKNKITAIGTVASFSEHIIGFEQIFEEYTGELFLEVRISLDNLMRVQCINLVTSNIPIVAELGGVERVNETYVFTPLGMSFIQACMTD